MVCSLTTYIHFQFFLVVIEKFDFKIEPRYGTGTIREKVR